MSNNIKRLFVQKILTDKEVSNLEGTWIDESHIKLPLIKENVLMSTAIIEMTKKRFGCLGVVSKANTLIGIITDGDLRRHMGNSILEKKTTSIMTKKPKTVNKDIFASEALDIMKKSKITQVFITENNKPIGILHIHDCIELELA